MHAGMWTMMLIVVVRNVFQLLRQIKLRRKHVMPIQLVVNLVNLVQKKYVQERQMLLITTIVLHGCHLVDTLVEIHASIPLQLVITIQMFLLHNLKLNKKYVNLLLIIMQESVNISKLLRHVRRGLVMVKQMLVLKQIVQTGCNIVDGQEGYPIVLTLHLYVGIH